MHIHGLYVSKILCISLSNAENKQKFKCLYLGKKKKRKEVESELGRKDKARVMKCVLTF